MARNRDQFHPSGRIALAVLLGLAALAIAPLRPVAAGQPEVVVVEAIAAVEAAGLTTPLFVGLAQVIVPPGVRSEAAGTPGPRLLAVESGTLTVGLTTTAKRGMVTRAASTPGISPREIIGAGGEAMLGPGDRLALGPSSVREVRNDGAKPAVFLDAALFPPGPEPVTAAFTTPDGIVFQLLAGSVADALPAGPISLVLERVRVPPGAALPSTARAGTALAYVESGSLALVPQVGAVRYSRAAAPAPFSVAAPMREIALGAETALTAGASVFLPAGAAVEARNGRTVPAVLLFLEVRPSGATGA